MKSKEELKKLLNKAKDDEKLVEKYITTFNNYFQKEQEKDPNINILESIFTNFISLAYKVTNTHLFLSNELVEAENGLKETFTEEQKRIFEIYDYIQTEYSTDYALKGFVYAYCLGKELNKEVENFINKGKQLQDTISILKNNMKKITDEDIEKIRSKYKKGTKIQLIKMHNDPQPVPDGTIGIVDFVDDIGTIHMIWENGSSLGLIIGEDKFEIIERK